MTAAPADAVVVRPARLDEAAEVAWLAALTFPLACPPGTPVATMAAHISAHLTPARFRAWSASDRHALVVAELPVPEGPARLVGYALVVLGMPDGPAEAAAVREATGWAGPSVELSKIYVDPAAQGTGVAGALMEGAIDGARRLAASAGHDDGLPLWLGTNAQNARAQAFYRRHGFAVVGRRTYDVGGVEHDDVVMLHTGDGR